MEPSPKVPFINVRSDNNIQSVGRVIASQLQQRGDRVDIRAVGAGAVNQSVKALAYARHAVFQRGLRLSLIPYIEDGIPREDGASVTRVVLKVEVH